MDKSTKPKISKPLENMMARVVFDTTRRGVSSTLNDRLALEILHNEGALAYQLLTAHLRQWELQNIVRRLDRQIHLLAAYGIGNPSSEQALRDFGWPDFLPLADAPPTLLLPLRCGAKECRLSFYDTRSTAPFRRR